MENSITNFMVNFYILGALLVIVLMLFLILAKKEI